MRLSLKTIDQIRSDGLPELPLPESFHYPEKILQFGTGVLLRGLPDLFINKANRQGLFRGRIVMVKSTDKGTIQSFKEQDHLYTVCVRGVKDGEKVEKYIISNAVAAVFSAREEWDKVLRYAAEETMQIIISNTTEVGIQLTDDSISDMPPSSFPGKLLSFLHARYEKFKGAEDKGMIIIPTELITDNGQRLRQVLLQLAAKNDLSEEFMQWLDSANVFCNSLVDRIVPGKLSKEDQKRIEEKLNYEDDLMISAEPYHLWAIEISKKNINRLLPVSQADSGIILADDISKHRELKLRLLNGTHTFSCALAYLKGFDTVKEAVDDEKMGAFIQKLMMEEIVPVISGGEISSDEACAFASKIFDRFKNPYIFHQWLSITTEYSSKVKTRTVPLLSLHYQKLKAAPPAMSLGLAAYLLFMRSDKNKDGSFHGTYHGRNYLINDSLAGILYEWWKTYPGNPVSAVLSDTRLWDTDLTQLPGLVEEIEKYLLPWIEGQEINIEMLFS